MTHPPWSEGAAARQIDLFPAPDGEAIPIGFRRRRPQLVPMTFVLLATQDGWTCGEIARAVGCDRSYIARLRRRLAPERAKPRSVTPTIGKRRCWSCGRLAIAEAANAPRCACGAAW